MNLICLFSFHFIIYFDYLTMFLYPKHPVNAQKLCDMVQGKVKGSFLDCGLLFKSMS